MRQSGWVHDEYEIDCRMFQSKSQGELYNVTVPELVEGVWLRRQ